MSHGPEGRGLEGKGGSISDSSQQPSSCTLPCLHRLLLKLNTLQLNYAGDQARRFQVMMVMKQQLPTISSFRQLAAHASHTDGSR